MAFPNAALRERLLVAYSVEKLVAETFDIPTSKILRATATIYESATPKAAQSRTLEAIVEQESSSGRDG